MPQPHWPRRKRLPPHYQAAPKGGNAMNLQSAKDKGLYLQDLQKTTPAELLSFA